MEIKFSRHAKKRAKLYNIHESTIMNILKGKEILPGTNKIIEKVEGFKYPLKNVITSKDDIITVITNYPLKKRRKK